MRSFPFKAERGACTVSQNLRCIFTLDMKWGHDGHLLAREINEAAGSLPSLIQSQRTSQHQLRVTLIRPRTRPAPRGNTCHYAGRTCVSVWGVGCKEQQAESRPNCTADRKEAKVRAGGTISEVQMRHLQKYTM